MLYKEKHIDEYLKEFHYSTYTFVRKQMQGNTMNLDSNIATLEAIKDKYSDEWYLTFLL